MTLENGNGAGADAITNSFCEYHRQERALDDQEGLQRENRRSTAFQLLERLKAWLKEVIHPEHKL